MARVGLRRPIGLILAGGQSTRLGGGDKALRTLEGATLLGRVMARLAPQCEALWLSANGDLARFAAFGLTATPDHAEDVGCGPLAGVLSGLDHIAARDGEVRWVVSIPADTPFAPSDLVARLDAARRDTGSTVVCARSGGRPHPLAALWSMELRGDLRVALREDGVRRVGDFIRRQTVAWADWPAHPLDPFLNVNTSADWEVAQRYASAGSGPFSDAEGDDRAIPLD